MASDADLSAHVPDLCRARVLVVGDLMLDRYWFGDVDRISPEAPVPVVAVRQTEERLGGAANVALNVCTLGGSSTLLGIIGDDAAGAALTHIAAKAGIQSVFKTDPTVPTSLKQRVIARNQQLIRADFEELPGAESTAALLDEVERQIDKHDAVVLSDYGKGSLRHCQQMIQIAKSCNVPVLVDPKGTDFSRYAGAAMVTPNLREFEAVAGKFSVDDATSDEMVAKAADLMTRFDLHKILVTLSEKGMVLFDKNALPAYSPARSREVYDVSGAGDTVIAVMGMCAAVGISTDESLQIANSAAGVVVSKLGTASVNQSELLAAMLRDSN